MKKPFIALLIGMTVTATFFVSASPANPELFQQIIPSTDTTDASGYTATHALVISETGLKQLLQFLTKRMQPTDESSADMLPVTVNMPGQNPLTDLMLTNMNISSVYGTAGPVMIYDITAISISTEIEVTLKIQGDQLTTATVTTEQKYFDISPEFGKTYMVMKERNRL